MSSWFGFGAVFKIVSSFLIFFAALALCGGTWFRCALCGRATLAARAADRSALDGARPLGRKRGGSPFFHVDLLVSRNPVGKTQRLHSS